VQVALDEQQGARDDAGVVAEEEAADRRDDGHPGDLPVVAFAQLAGEIERAHAVAPWFGRLLASQAR
jgi:hypothetical protein